MKALRNLLLTGAALAPLAPLAAHAQVTYGQVPPIVVYDYPAQHPHYNGQPLCLTKPLPNDACPRIVGTGTDPKSNKYILNSAPYTGRGFQYLISAKATMHNFHGGPQDGACVLYANLDYPQAIPVIIDKTSVKMGETVQDADTVSIALQGAFIDNYRDSTFPDKYVPINEIAVACTTGEADVGESVLTIIPFQQAPSPMFPFTCPEEPNSTLSKQGEPCTPNTNNVER